ncbi:hypothetical protein AADZ91_18205 [Colwelliaceae bacterium 6441]
MLTFHIIAGSFVLIFGLGSLIFQKGNNLHRHSGNLFFLSLILMAVSAIFLADDPTIAISSIYFASTAWVVTIKPEKKTGIFEIIALITISLICARYFYVATTSEPGFMVTMFYIFGTIALLAALLDLNYIVRGGLIGVHRISRHLWRMCYAMLGAVLSFVANTSDKWPQFIDANLPIYALIAIMLFWLIRVLFTKWLDKSTNFIGKGSSIVKLINKRA